MNKVPANQKKKQNSFKNKNFHTGHISMYTLTVMGFLSVGVSATRLIQHPQPSNLLHLWPRRSLIWVPFSSLKHFTSAKKVNFMNNVLAIKALIRKPGLSSPWYELRLPLLVLLGNTQWGVERKELSCDDHQGQVKKGELGSSPWPQEKYMTGQGNR